MKCVREDLKAHITDVLVGEADTAVSEQVLDHLETCPSCREDRDRMARVLGLLKEAPPWAESAADADTLSVIQRQRVESLAARRGPAPKAAKPAGLPASWLAMAASLAVMGVALFLARRGAAAEQPENDRVPRGGLRERFVDRLDDGGFCRLRLGAFGA